MKDQWWNEWTELYAKIGKGEEERSYHLLVLLFFKRQQDLSETPDWWSKTLCQCTNRSDAEWARSLAEQLRRVIICGGFVGQAARLYDGIETAFRFFREEGSVALVLHALNQLKLRELATDAMGAFFARAAETWEIQQGLFVPEHSTAELLVQMLKAEAGVSIYDPWAEGGSLLLQLLNSKTANHRPLLLGQPTVQARQTDARRKLLIMMKMISSGVWAELIPAGQVGRRSGYQCIISAPAVQLTETMLAELLTVLSYDGRAVLYCRREPTAGVRKRLAQTAELVEVLLLPSEATGNAQVLIFDCRSAASERLIIWDFRAACSVTGGLDDLRIMTQYEQGDSSAWRREIAKVDFANARWESEKAKSVPAEPAADQLATLAAIERLTEHWQRQARLDEAVGETTVGTLLERISRFVQRTMPK